MLILIAIIFFLSADRDFSAAAEWEASEREAERRHQELLEATREARRRKSSNSYSPRVIRRRYIKDKYGNILSEEIIVDTDD